MSKDRVKSTLFRGWDNQNECWRHGYMTLLIEGARRFNAIVNYDEEGELTRWYIHHEDSIGICTNIKDNNGNGVNTLWEDDLVRCSGQGIGKVVQNYWGEWCVLFADDQCIPIHDLIMEQDLLELVGNIHENSELFEG